MASFHIAGTQSHTVWDRAISPALTVEPGATVELEVTNASGGQFDRHASAEVLRALDFGRVNPVTGPILVKGAEVGDALVVEVLGVEVDSWAWTANIPGFGLLASDFPEPHLRISTLTGRQAELLPGLRIPVVPFIGTIGLARAAAGPHPIIPPGPQGGNMDIRHITAGCRLWLPVAVSGALLSLGDTHAAQGDGEVCGTAIETNALVRIRIHLDKQRRLTFPMLETDPVSARSGLSIATTGIGPDLMEAAKAATRGMVEEIVHRTGMQAVDAYLLASVAADLKISEIVDQPNWVVSLHLERDLLEGSSRI